MPARSSGLLAVQIASGQLPRLHPPSRFATDTSDADQRAESHASEHGGDQEHPSPSSTGKQDIKHHTSCQDRDGDSDQAQPPLKEQPPQVAAAFTGPTDVLTHCSPRTLTCAANAHVERPRRAYASQRTART